MKKTIYLNESDGYEPDSRCRRVEVFGRLELLRAFFDGPAFWMIRLRGRTPEDRPILEKATGSKFGNGHWRFVDEKSARAKFSQLCSLPEYVSDEEKRQKTLDRRREAFLKVKVSIQPKSKPGIEGKTGSGSAQ